MFMELLKSFIPKFLIFISIVFLLFHCAAIDEITKPTAKSTSTGGPTIEQARKEDYMGPKARIAVTRFEDKSAKGKSTGEIGDGMAEMLGNALFATNRFIVLERQTLGDVLQEQDLGASGRVRRETAAGIGEIEGADLLIRGTVTEFEPGTSGAGGGIGGGTMGIITGVLASIRTSHVAMVVKVIDAKTSRILASEQVEGKATDFGGGIGGAGGGLAGVFGMYSKTPMEKAIRVAIEEAVRVIVAKTPAEYYRVPTVPPAGTISPPAPTPSAPVPIPTPPPATSLPTQPPPVQPQPPSVAPEPLPRFTQVTVSVENLRDSPDGKKIGIVKKGTSLAVLDEKKGKTGDWLNVRLEDGTEAWIWKASTSEAPKASSPPAKPPQPKAKAPM
jgi:curli biogenesis system outer membrane secretion channel CsgG